MDEDLINLKVRMDEMEQKQAVLRQKGYMPLQVHGESRRKSGAKRINAIDNNIKKKDFEPICDAIGVELVVPDYSWKKQTKETTTE